MINDVIARINELAKKQKGRASHRRKWQSGTGCGGFIWILSGRISQRSWTTRTW